MAKSSERKLKVFLSYARGDRDAVRALYDRLSSEAWIEPWIDIENLVPGDNWVNVTQNNLRNADVVIVILSNSSVNKAGFVQREIKYALDRFLEMPEGTLFLIPARLDNCLIPRHISRFHAVDLHEKNGYEKLLSSLKVRATQVGINPKKGRPPLFKKSESQYQDIKSLPNQNVQYKKRSPILLYIRIVLIISGVVFLALGIYRVVVPFLKKIDFQPLIDLLPVVCGVPVLLIVLGIVAYGVNSYISSIKDNKSLQKKEFVELQNPFIAGNPIDPIENRRMFFGRVDVVQLVQKEIKKTSQKPSLLLYGRRRMGKTSALLNLGRSIRDLSIVDVFVDAQDIKYRTDSDLSFNLITQVVHKLKEVAFVNELFPDEDYYLDESKYKQKPILVLSKFFSEAQNFLEKENLYCLFMFDEYELLGDDISKDFFMQIRNAMQHKNRFIFLFSGAHMPNEFSANNWKEVFMNVKVLHISFLDRDASYKLLTEPVPQLKYANEKIINEILNITGCQPLLLQAMASTIVNILNTNKKTVVTKKVIADATEKVLDAWSHNFFDHIWNYECNLDKDKELIMAIAKNKGRMKKTTAKSYGQSLNKLIQRDLLTEVDEDIKLTMPIVKNWLLRKNHI